MQRWWIHKNVLIITSAGDYHKQSFNEVYSRQKSLLAVMQNENDTIVWSSLLKTMWENLGKQINVFLVTLSPVISVNIPPETDRAVNLLLVESDNSISLAVVLTKQMSYRCSIEQVATEHLPNGCVDCAPHADFNGVQFWDYNNLPSVRHILHLLYFSRRVEVEYVLKVVNFLNRWVIAGLENIFCRNILSPKKGVENIGVILLHHTYIIFPKLHYCSCCIVCNRDFLLVFDSCKNWTSDWQYFNSNLDPLVVLCSLQL